MGAPSYSCTDSPWRQPTAPWPPPPPCARVLLLILFFSVSPWLRGEYSFSCGFAAPCPSVAQLPGFARNWPPSVHSYTPAAVLPNSWTAPLAHSTTILVAESRGPNPKVSVSSDCER